VLLVIEIADTSLRYDRDVKTSPYAKHGIAEMWLVDVRAKRLTRYRDPAGNAYARVDEPDVREPLDLPVGTTPGVVLAPLFED
jgi:Uma2 family endonuclease